MDFRDYVGDGRFGMAAMAGTLAVVDGVTLGVDSLLEIPAKAGLKRIAENVAAKEAGDLAKTGIEKWPRLIGQD